MEKAIIYGCGEQGRKTYEKYKELFNVLYFSDRDAKLHNTSVFGKKIVPPKELKVLLCKGDTVLIIASTYYKEIIDNLIELGVDLSYGKVYYANPANSFLNKYMHINELSTYKYKANEYKYVPSGIRKKIKKVLFVKTLECQRISKIACCLKKRGINVDLAYLIQKSYHHENQMDKYGTVYQIRDLNEFSDFVNNSDYDIIHSSNFPDFLTAFLLFCNKPIVHDTHDLGSITYSMNDNQIIDEYMALKFSSGNLFCTEITEAYVTERFNLRGKPSCYITNSVLEDYKPKKYLPKLSEKDGMTHCVYHGTITSDEDKNDKRYVEDIFLKIADCGVHVHFYSIANFEKMKTYYENLAAKSPFIHYEGSVPMAKLMELLTQYDIGLFVFNRNNMADLPFAISSQNRSYEYPFCGLPMAVSDLFSFKSFAEKYNLGRALDLEGDIYGQLEEIKNIQIPINVLERNGLTMESQIDRLMDFYGDCIDYYNTR